MLRAVSSVGSMACSDELEAFGARTSKRLRNYWPSVGTLSASTRPTLAFAKQVVAVSTTSRLIIMMFRRKDELAATCCRVAPPAVQHG